MLSRCKDGILIIDADYQNCLNRKNIILSRLADGYNYQFYFAHSIDQAISMMRNDDAMRLSLCSIFMDQSLTAAHNLSLDTNARDYLRQLETTINELKHHHTVLCLYADSDGVEIVKKDLSRAHEYQPGKTTFPTQLVDSSQRWSGDAMAQIVANAQAISQAGLTGRVDDLACQLRSLQDTLTAGTLQNPSYLERVSLNEQSISTITLKFDELSAELRSSVDGIKVTISAINEKLETLSDTREIQVKFLDAILSGFWGKALMVGLSAAIAILLFGEKVWPALIELLRAIG